MNLIYDPVAGTLTNGATLALGIVIAVASLIGAAWARRSLDRNAPAPYWLIRWEHHLKHLFREPHDCLDVLTDSRPEWY